MTHSAVLQPSKTSKTLQLPKMVSLRNFSQARIPLLLAKLGPFVGPKTIALDPTFGKFYTH